jgi:hypothetical protein
VPSCVPFKSAKKIEKALSILPDKAEEVSLRLLNDMCEDIGQVYALLAWVGNEWVPVCGPLPIRPFAADSHSTTSHPRAGEATRAQLGPPEKAVLLASIRWVSYYLPSTNCDAQMYDIPLPHDSSLLRNDDGPEVIMRT